MIKIEEGKELIMENVLSLREKMSQEQVQEEMVKIGELWNLRCYYDKNH